MNTVSRTPPSVPLRDLATFNPPAPSLNSDDEVAFVPMAAVSEAGVIEITEHLRVADLKPGYSYMQSGDALIAKITPCFENNKIALAALDRPHGFGSTEFHVVRADASALDGRYLVHFLRQDEVRRAGERRMTGSAGQRRVPRQFFEELAIPLPPLDEQRRIAAILDQADDLRRKRREAMDWIAMLVDAVFSGLIGRTPSELNRWPQTTVGEICLVRGGKRLPKGDEYSSTPTPFRYIRVSDLDEGKIRENELVYLKPETQSRISRYTVREGDIIISIAGSIGLIAEVPASLSGANLTENAAKLVSKMAGRYHPAFLARLLEAPFVQNQIRSKTGQVTIGKLALFRIEQIEIPLPPLDLQHAFAARVAEIDKLKTHHRAQLAKLDALFASLQHRAFRGEL